ncbi:hypothetical protein BN1012_Phect1025 [Candidatus Phaeomarinobacter ectocarpi]|uniref:Uncharacterized protein n=1 Tax=Candidatus Phaeomarinibacter ectocarpi TaxID=1458461 RepID=X5MEJ1_9HYPH|nr:hypothetical protein BN1012_Phect1025 [Candidatus Phaeomarinobacter ectocarpi]
MIISRDVFVVHASSSVVELSSSGSGHVSLLEHRGSCL